MGYRPITDDDRTMAAIFACLIVGITAFVIIALCWDNLKSLF
jgi:hypothetical protein